MKWYFAAFQKFAQFSGRSRRMEYWMFGIISFIVSILLPFVDGALGLTFQFEGVSIGFGPISVLYFLLVIIPGLALTVRRLHDLDKSGWFLLIILIPLIGALIFLINMFMAGTPGPNRYGSDPKERD